MLQSLKNKKIIISAGASGIGWSTAKICLSKGAIVYICDIDNKSLNKIRKHPLTNKRLFPYKCDASDEDEVSSFFNEINKKTKKIDALINNVGIAGPTGTIDKSNLIKVQEDQFLDEFLPKVVCSNANCEVVDKEGNVKGYITQKELSKALTKEHMVDAVKSA